MKWIYDKSTQKSHRHCFCDNPCTSSKCGRMVYIYPEKDLRAYPGTIRGTEEWMIPIKSGLLSKEISTTSKTISVLQDAEPK